MSRPWLSVEEDGEGTTMVLVKERHLLDFPYFMKFIIEEKIGLEQGVFKINIVDRQGGAKLDEILNIVKKYYSTLKSETRLTQTGNVKTVHGYPEINMQTFNFSRKKDDHLYGYYNAFRTNAEKKDRADILNKVDSPESFLSETTCCLQMLSKSLKDLVEHYWSTIATVAAGANPICYGAGISVEEDVKFSSNFSLFNLRTILDVCPINYPGITKPYLYVGSKHATFPWHIEDSALFSTNALCFGAPCVWFFVPPHLYKQFVEQIQFFPLDLNQTSCVNVLGHKYLLASEDFLLKCGIRVHTVVQRENDIIVAYPFAAHSGFKCGANIQIAVNFGDPWWVEPAILAPTCVCFVTQIQLDLKEIIAITKKHLLQDYVNQNYLELYKQLKKNDFIRRLGILPSSSALEDTVSNEQTSEALMPAQVDFASDCSPSQ